MAKEFEDGELWLPSEFLCDEVFLGGGGKEGLGGAGFPCEFPYGFGSNLDSPVESVTETEESDEDEDYMAGLTQQMACFFLQDDDKEAFGALETADNAKPMARSPQSTLSAWSATSSKGSPNGPSLVSSPPSSFPLEQHSKDDPCDLLCEAADQVMRLQQNELGRRESLYDRGILGVPSKPSPPVYAAPKNNTGYYSPSPLLTHQQLQAAHFYHLRRQQAMKQKISAAWGRQSKARGGGYGESRCGRPLDLSPSAWPPLRKSPTVQQQQQQQHPPPLPGSGMRAVFLHSAGGRKESAGTGVFLPRTAGNKLEPRKKIGCSTVLVPDRVVQALNLNLEEFAAQPRFPGGFVLSHDVLIGRSSAVPSHPKKNQHHLNRQPAAAAVASAHEIGLPQEWTY